MTFHRTLTALAVVAPLALTACEDDTPPGDNAAMRQIDTERVMRIDAVDTAVTEGASGPGLTIQATGTVNSGGWTDIKLVVPEERPFGEIISIEMVGTPPDGAASQALTEVQAQTTIYQIPDWVESYLVAGLENEIKRPMPAAATVNTPEEDIR